MGEDSILSIWLEKTGGTNEDIKLRHIWKNHQMRRNKLWIFETNVKSVLLYACLTWRVTNKNMNKLQIYIV